MEYNVNVTDNGSVARSVKSIRGYSKEVAQAEGNTRRASTATGELNYKLNQGVTGTSSAARSFSKLNQAIGHGPNSLVGAYATLAANTFAVVAAFTALREAAQVEQVLKGLELQGAKTGRTLEIAAQKLKTITGDAISTADALRATAQVNAAGFGEKELLSLGNVATNAALALGRSIPDALERISRGVTKLEPELLDELGLMTKLTEATSTYALQTGKSANSLSSFERRQAFLNAIVAEGELKFRGIREEIGTNPYDRLAASFDNLVKKILGVVNIFGKLLASLGAINENVLLGGLLLFGSTIGKQLIPSLYTLSNAALDNKKKLLEQSEASKKAAASALENARAQQAQAIANSRNLRELSYAPKKYREVADSLKAGTAEAKDYQQAITSIDRSIRARGAQLKNQYMGTPLEAEKKAQIRDLAALRKEVNTLEATEQKYSSVVISSTEESKKATYGFLAARREASAQGNRANAIQLAGNLEVRASWKALTLAVREYSIAQALAARAQFGKNVPQSVQAINKLQTGLFAAGTGLRAFGAAAIGFLPQLALITIAVSLASEAYDKLFKTDADREKAKAIAEYTAIVDAAGKKIKELIKTQQSLASISGVTTQALTLQGNAITELGEATQAALREFSDASKAQKEGNNVASLWEAIIGNENDLASYLTGLAKNSDFVKPFEAHIKNIQDSNQSYSQSAENIGTLLASVVSPLNKEQVLLAKTTDSLTKLIGKDFVAALEASYGGATRLAGSPALQKSFIAKAMEAYKGLATAVKGLEESFKQAETASTEFINSASVSTKYDDILKSFQQINSAIFEVRNNVALTNGEEFGLLAGIGANTQRFLTTENQALLDKARVQFQIKQTLEAQVRDGFELTNVQERQLTSAKKQLELMSAQKSVILDNIKSVEDQLTRMQEIERLRKSEIESIQAIMNANQKAYQSGERGTLARIAREEQIRGLQIDQLNSQLAINQSLIAASEATLNQAKAQRVLSEGAARAHSERLREHEQELEVLLAKREISQKLIDDPAGATTLDKLLLSSGDVSLLNALAKVRDAQKFTGEQLNLTEKIRQEEIAIRGIRSANAAIQNAINNLAQANLTSEQKLAYAAEAKLESQKEINSLYDANKESLKDIDALSKRVVDTLNSSSTASFYGINETLANAEKELNKIRTDTKREIETISTLINSLEADRKAAASRGNKLEADAFADQIATQRKLIEAKTLTRDLDETRLTLNTALSILEKAIVDTNGEGLEIQQKSVDVLKAQFSEKEKALAVDQEIYSINKDIQAIRNGTSIGEKASKAIEYKALQEQIALAKQQIEIKKYGIELEYNLLEAQKLALVEELKARREIIAKTAQAAGISNESIDLMTGQLSAAISNLERASYDSVKSMALQNEDRAIELLEKRAEKARAEIIGAPFKDSYFGKVMQAVADSKTILEALNTSSKPASVTKPDNPVVNSNIALDNRLTETNRLLSELNNLFGKVTGLQSRLDSSKPLEEITTSIIEGVSLGLPFSRSSITSGFGPRKRPKKGASKNHLGLDFGVGEGTPIYATAPGTARLSSSASGYGNRIAIEALTKAGTTFATTFSHLSKFAVREGEKVVKGQLIGYSGNTGTSTGPHLHYEVLVNGHKINPNGIEKINLVTEVTRPSESRLPSLGMDSLSTPPIRETGPEGFGETINVVATRSEAASQKLSAASEKVKINWSAAFVAIQASAQPFLDQMKELGPEGTLVSTALSGVFTMSDAILAFGDSVKEGGVSVQNIGMLMSAALSTIGSVLTAASDAKIANIEREIAAEQKRDGKSAESVAKLEQMEKKKEAIARKQFNTNKKLMMAQTVIATAAGIAGILAHSLELGLAAPIFAGIIGAMGAAQLALIASTNYQSTATAATVATPSSLSIGKRGSEVDLASGANRNAGGEIGYLRGQSGMGTNASDYRTIGSAYGGNPFRGYGNRGIVVGEKGPETINPEVPISVTPNNEMNKSPTVHATFNVNAIDSKGVQDMLVSQKGNIIKMIRDAANANGDRFLEGVDVNVYTRPSVSKL